MSRLTQQQIKDLNVESTEMMDGDSFIYNIDFYKFKDRDWYLSQWDFKAKRPLAEKDQWSILARERIKNKRVTAQVIVTSEVVKNPSLLKGMFPDIEQSLQKSAES